MLAVSLVVLAACAPRQEPRGPDRGLAGGECTVEVLNATPVVLEVADDAGRSTLGALGPGERLRFGADCARGRVTVSGRTPGDLASGGASCHVTVAVDLREGEAVHAVLRTTSAPTRVGADTGCRGPDPAGAPLAPGADPT